MALKSITCYFFFNGFLVAFGKILHWWCRAWNSNFEWTLLCGARRKKQKAEKTLPWHSGAAFRSFLGPISRNPFSDWNKRTKWQLVIDLVASSPRQKYLHTYNVYNVICNMYCILLLTLFTFSLSIHCLHTNLPTDLTTEKGSM